MAYCIAYCLIIAKHCLEACSQLNVVLTSDTTCTMTHKTK